MAGLGKYFNSETYTGRANVAKATYASFALIYLYFRLKSFGKKTETETPLPAEPSAPAAPPTPPTYAPCPCVPCQPSCTPAMPSPPPPPCDDPSKVLKEDPLFKQKVPPSKKGASANDCDDDDCEDEC